MKESPLSHRTYCPKISPLTSEASTQAVMLEITRGNKNYCVEYFHIQGGEFKPATCFPSTVTFHIRTGLNSRNTCSKKLCCSRPQHCLALMYWYSWMSLASEKFTSGSILHNSLNKSVTSMLKLPTINI